jgi:Flp pilus assembly protein TadD
MTLRSVAVLLLLSGVLLNAADRGTPTAEEWGPVQQAIDGGRSDANARLLALLNAYPAWADGSRMLAKLLLEQGRAAEALAAARRANALAPDDSESLRLQIRALAELKRPAEIATLVDNAGGLDPRGWLRYEAGLAAVNLGDAARAEKMLAGARSRAGQQGQPEFLFLESRIAILGRDYPRAEQALTKATSLQATFWDAWYELGRIRLTLADQVQAERSQWLKKAGEAFAIVTSNIASDPNAQVGLGRTAMEQAKDLQTAGQDDQAGGQLRTAVGHLQKALTLKPDLVEAQVLLGDALLRLGRWSEAVTALRQAQKLGAKERSVTFNLAIALQQSGQIEAATALLGSITAANPGEQATLGMGAYRARNWLVAIALLSGAAEHLEDAATRGATLRFLGHAHGHLAATLNGAEAEEHRDAAAAAYRAAGDLKDFPARHFLLATEAARDPDHAYAAAWTAIGWDTLDLTAWGQALGNYGAAKTGGQGLAGMAARAPVHLAMWGALVLLPLLFFGLRLGRRQPATDPRPTPRQPAVKPASEPGMMVPTRRPPQAAPAPTRQPPVKPANRPAAVAQKTETEEITPPPSSQKAETVALVVPAPGIKPTLKPTLKPGLRQPSQIIPPSSAEQTLQATPSPEGRGQALERRKP